MQEWLDRVRAELAAVVGDEAASYALSQADVDDLLDLARVAAHDSGERMTAPITTYLVGIARGRHPEQSVSDLVGAVVGKQS